MYRALQDSKAASDLAEQHHGDARQLEADTAAIQVRLTSIQQLEAQSSAAKDHATASQARSNASLMTVRLKAHTQEIGVRRRNAREAEGAATLLMEEHAELLADLHDLQQQHAGEPLLPASLAAHTRASSPTSTRAGTPHKHLPSQ